MKSENLIITDYENIISPMDQKLKILQNSMIAWNCIY